MIECLRNLAQIISRYSSSYYTVDLLIVLKDSTSWYECAHVNKFDPILKKSKKMKKNKENEKIVQGVL
jgi:hypothetical protein